MKTVNMRRKRTFGCLGGWCARAGGHVVQFEDTGQQELEHERVKVLFSCTLAWFSFLDVAARAKPLQRFQTFFFCDFCFLSFLMLPSFVSDLSRDGSAVGAEEPAMHCSKYVFFMAQRLAQETKTQMFCDKNS